MQRPNETIRWYIYGLIAVCLAGLALLAINGSALAQSAPDKPKVEIKLKPSKMTRLEDQKPVQIDMKLDQVPGGNNRLADGVTVKAYARYVEVSGKKIAQVMVTGIERKDGTTVSLRDQNLMGQFDIEQPQLDPSVPVILEGDQEKLIAALNELRKATAVAAQEEEEQAEEEETTDTQPEQQQAAIQPANRSSGGTTSRGVSGNSSSNPTASGYKSPATTVVADDDDDDTPTDETGEIAVTETAEGCSIRIDQAQGFAYQQSRIVTTEGGKQTEATECADGTIRYEIQRSYQMCQDTVDLAALVVTAQYQLYYEDANQAKVLIGSCVADPELLYPVVEKTDDCDPVVNEQGEQVTAQAALVYYDKNNIETQVQACQDSTDTALTMARDYSVCDVNVDQTAGTATAFYQNYYENDGSKITVGDCKPDPERIFPIEQNFNLCANQVDQTAGKAYRQYQRYYVNSQQARIDVGDCTPDMETPFDIVETRSGCSTFIDYDEGTATPMVRLVYVDDNNAEQEVRSCDASTALTDITMEKVSAPCTIRHDFEAGTSYSQSIWSYDDDGQTYQVGECMDDGVTYAHQTIYKDAFGQNFCDPVVNMVSGKATMQHRIAIDVDGESALITDCTPDATSQDIIATTDGCSDPVFWTHDVSAGRSYGQERFYYDDAGTPIYVSQCQTSSRVYTHESEQTGWQNNDDGLYAFQVQDVYITTDSGRYYVQRDHIPNGAVQVAYTLKEETSSPSGAPIYVGCTKTTEVLRKKVWTRPDGTEYQQTIGTDMTETSEGVCVSVGDAPVWRKIATSGPAVDLSQHDFAASVFTPFENNTCETAFDGMTYTYQGTRNVYREDGASFTQVNAINRNIFGLGFMQHMVSYYSEGPPSILVDEYDCVTNTAGPTELDANAPLNRTFSSNTQSATDRDIAFWNDEGWE